LVAHSTAASVVVANISYLGTSLAIRRAFNPRGGSLSFLCVGTPASFGMTPQAPEYWDGHLAADAAAAILCRQYEYVI